MSILRNELLRHELRRYLHTEKACSKDGIFLKNLNTVFPDIRSSATTHSAFNILSNNSVYVVDKAAYSTAWGEIWIYIVEAEKGGKE